MTLKTSSYALWHVGPDYARGMVRWDVGTEELVYRDQSDKRLRSGISEAACDLVRAICAVSTAIGKTSARSGGGMTAMAGCAHWRVNLRDETRARVQ